VRIIFGALLAKLSRDADQLIGVAQHSGYAFRTEQECEGRESHPEDVQSVSTMNESEVAP
jgi:hypothetical protein